MSLQEEGSSIYYNKLKRLERQVSTSEGATSLLKDAANVAFVLDFLKRPAAGNGYKQWVISLELTKAIGIGSKILEYCGQTKETQRFSQAIIAASRAALPIRPDTSAAAADILAATEQALAGRDFPQRNIKKVLVKPTLNPVYAHQGPNLSQHFIM